MQHAPIAPQPLTDPSQAWEFIPGFEPAEAYEAFAWYRDMGPSRSLARCARDLSISYGTVVRWAAGFLWRDRCLSYDTYRAQARELERQQAEKAVDQKWSEIRAERLSQLNELADLGAAQLLRRLRTRGGELRPNELVQVNRLLLHFGNLANGDATDRVDTQLDFANMTDEQLAALELLRDVRANALPGDGAKDDEE